MEAAYTLIAGSSFSICLSLIICLVSTPLTDMFLPGRITVKIDGRSAGGGELAGCVEQPVLAARPPPPGQGTLLPN